MGDTYEPSRRRAQQREKRLSTAAATVVVIVLTIVAAASLALAVDRLSNDRASVTELRASPA